MRYYDSHPSASPVESETLLAPLAQRLRDGHTCTGFLVLTLVLLCQLVTTTRPSRYTDSKWMPRLRAILEGTATETGDRVSSLLSFRIWPAP